MADENAPLTPSEPHDADVPVAAEEVIEEDREEEVAYGRAPKRKRRRPARRPVESAEDALKRQAEPELMNEILAGGAVAASFTAAAGIAKAKIEATTQRRKNELDAETERLRIESEERIARLQAAATAGTDPEDAENSEA
ncbi:hypothetical protein ACTWJ8_03020 [Streptomyces sp. SDT5-1]|uniref:hypothetical protein n=1 Tax=Streptomyces sp. SDT5-1 TaxID=3406418 RepID=UPI003FD536F4